MSITSDLNKAKTHCKRGHEFTQENTRLNKSGGRCCRECERLRSGYSGIGTGQYRRPRPKSCPRGHDYTPENSYIDKGGRIKCRDCRLKHNKDERLKRIYGISASQKQAIYEVQGGMCAVCGADIDSYSAIDHCHQSGVIRGLLCLSCNTAEGMVKATGLTAIEWAKRLTAYLKRPSTPLVAA